MPWFMCEYSAYPKDKVRQRAEIGNYSSFIWANDRAHADALAAKRRLGEKVLCRWNKRGRNVPYEPPSTMLMKRRLTPTQRIGVIHGVCFLGYILLRSYRAPVEGVLGDMWILHQVIHGMQFGFPPRKKLAEMVRHYERMAPGYWPQR